MAEDDHALKGSSLYMMKVCLGPKLRLPYCDLWSLSLSPKLRQTLFLERIPADIQYLTELLVTVAMSGDSRRVRGVSGGGTGHVGLATSSATPILNALSLLFFSHVIGRSHILMTAIELCAQVQPDGWSSLGYTYQEQMSHPTWYGWCVHYPCFFQQVTYSDDSHQHIWLLVPTSRCWPDRWLFFVYTLEDNRDYTVLVI